VTTTTSDLGGGRRPETLGTCTGCSFPWGTDEGDDGAFFDPRPGRPAKRVELLRGLVTPRPASPARAPGAPRWSTPVRLRQRAAVRRASPQLAYSAAEAGALRASSRAFRPSVPARGFRRVLFYVAGLSMATEQARWPPEPDPKETPSPWAVGCARRRVPGTSGGCLPGVLAASRSRRARRPWSGYKRMSSEPVVERVPSSLFFSGVMTSHRLGMVVEGPGAAQGLSYEYAEGESSSRHIIKPVGRVPIADGLAPVLAGPG